MHTCLFTAMADSCNSSSKEECAFLLSALAVLLQIDEEEKTPGSHSRHERHNVEMLIIYRHITLV